MHLVQILLPVYGNDGAQVLRDNYPGIRDELVARFGGLTAFIQSPAEGLWTGDGNHAGRDDIVMLEIMVKAIERGWWETYRDRLQELLRQESIVVRVLPIERI